MPDSKDRPPLGYSQSTMDLRQLDFFLRVAEHGSLTKAAADLAVAQPVLSRQIRDLEQELGAPLLSRNGRGVVLTEAGRRFLARAKSITQDAAAAREEVRSLRERPSGSVSIAMAPSAGNLLWIPLISSIRRRFPDIRLRAMEGYSGHIVEWLVSGKADLGVLYQPQQAGHLRSEPLLEERMYAVGTPDNPALGATSIDFEELLRMPLILPAMPHAIRGLLESTAAKRGLAIDPEVEINAYPAIKSVVIARRALTVLPVASVLAEVHSGQIAIAEIANPRLALAVALVTSTHHNASAATRAVCAVVREVVAEMISSGRWPESHG